MVRPADGGGVGGEAKRATAPRPGNSRGLRFPAIAVVAVVKPRTLGLLNCHWRALQAALKAGGRGGCATVQATMKVDCPWPPTSA